MNLDGTGDREGILDGPGIDTDDIGIVAGFQGIE